jgi:hypothetical protein
MSRQEVNGFKKGKSGNPSGRPVGTKNSSTKSWAAVRKLAMNDYCEAYQELREAMKLGEGWAHNLFFKELVPKKVYTDTILITPENDTAEARVAAITRGLSVLDELTHSEAMEEIKTFSKLKEAEDVTKNETIGGVSVLFLESAEKNSDDVEK